MDSMALYRGMDIGTAKPTAAERAAVPHHLLDMLPPEEECSVAQYLDAAGRAAADIRGRQRAVLFVGGTPLYLKALLRGIFQGRRPIGNCGAGSKSRPASRRRLAARPPGRGGPGGRPPPAPQRHAATDPGDRGLREDRPAHQPLAAAIRRRAAGRPVPRLRARPAADGVGRPHRPPCRGDVFRRPGRGSSHSALRPAPSSKTARQAVGYREVIEHLAGGRTLPETIELVKLHTRQLAKRQGTWFRSLSECRLLALRGGD